MDIADMEGDREAGVRTLPVLMGRQSALVFATALLSVGVGAAGVGILEGACACQSWFVVCVLAVACIIITRGYCCSSGMQHRKGYW